MGTINAKDLAETCPDLWKQHGEPAPTPAEKLLALPWAALGEPEALYHEVASERGIAWPDFERLVTSRLQGLTTNEARALFEALAARTGGEAIPEDVWRRATVAEVSSAGELAAKPRRR
eukprot:SRR837773.4048.p2 GENE.SRR837773.4048~~SRR837773.4048.p2  ORF type:complete len:132 (-),score=43.81 SRR837773.4048:147-503(-)